MKGLNYPEKNVIQQGHGCFIIFLAHFQGHNSKEKTELSSVDTGEIIDYMLANVHIFFRKGKFLNLFLLNKR